MKTQIIQKWRLTLLAAGLGFVAGCYAQSPDAPATVSSRQAESGPLDFKPAPDVVQEMPANSTVAYAAPKLDFTPSPATAEVLKLVRAGVSETLVLRFVQNASGTFGLGAQGIVYLTDLGASENVINAMMDHDSTASNFVAQTAPVAVAEPATVVAQPPAQTVVIEPPPVTVEYFYDTLAPYGSWVQIEGYGRCWQPVVVLQQPGWQPYCDRGHWVYSDFGWYWVSDYSWGNWAFHYGRWFRHPQRGWCWTPDNVWAPAWVSWRSSGDYCGWAPLPPAALYRPGIGFTYNNRAVGVGFEFGLDASFYTFVPLGHFNDRRPRQYFVPRPQVAQIYNRTAINNNFTAGDRHNTVINRGISPTAIAAATHAEIRPLPVRVRSAGRPAPTPVRSENRNEGGNNDRNIRPGGGSPLQSAALAPVAKQPNRSHSGLSDAMASPTHARSVPTLPVNERQHTPRALPVQVVERPVVTAPSTIRSQIVVPSMPARSQPVVSQERPFSQAPATVHSQPVALPPAVVPSAPGRGAFSPAANDKRNDRDH